MEIISRTDARNSGKKTYYTGKPCVNGHVAYRYVQSGTCSQCINGDRGSVADPNLAARKAAKDQLVQVRIRIYDDERENVAVGVWALAVMRFPELTQGDVDPQLLPKDKASGTSRYAFYCHKDDIDAVIELGKLSINARRNLTPEAVKAAQRTAAGFHS